LGLELAEGELLRQRSQFWLLLPVFLQEIQRGFDPPIIVTVGAQAHAAVPSGEVLRV
jgi:hypothetical protein